jgi:hypothetical protein
VFDLCPVDNGNNEFFSNNSNVNGSGGALKNGLLNQRIYINIRFYFSGHSYLP